MRSGHGIAGSLRILRNFGLGALALGTTWAQTYAWKPQPAKAAILVVVSHPDDEIGYLGGAITYYAGVRKLPVVFALMTNGDPVVGGTSTVRVKEAECAAWTYGLRNRPLFGGFQDACYGRDLACNWTAWGGREKAAQWVTSLIRKYQPDVVLSQDLNGDYGHPNHMGAAHAAMDGYFAAVDPARFPGQLDSLKTWQPKKLYLHGSAKSYREWCASHPGGAMCPGNCQTKACNTALRDTSQIKYYPPGRKLSQYCHNWLMAHPGLAGKRVFDIANQGGNCHVSQGGDNWCSPCNVFDLWDSKVGADAREHDLMENLDTAQYRPATALGNSDFQVRQGAEGGSLNFRVRVEFRQKASLSLHDLSGKEIATLFDGWVGPGDQDLEPLRLPGPGPLPYSGVYLVQMRMGAEQACHRIFLSR